MGKGPSRLSESRRIRRPARPVRPGGEVGLRRPQAQSRRAPMGTGPTLAHFLRHTLAIWAAITKVPLSIRRQ